MRDIYSQKFDISLKMSEPRNGNWPSKNYPVEAVFLSEITRHVNDMFQRAGIRQDSEFDKPKHMDISVTRRKETDYAELSMSAHAMLFLGGMAKAISDVIISEIIPNILPQTKKCGQCSTINNDIAKYCLQCGNKFEG